MFICRADVMLGQYQEHMPELFAIIKTLEPMLGEDHSGSDFIERWSQIKTTNH